MSQGDTAPPAPRFCELLRGWQPGEDLTLAQCQDGLDSLSAELSERYIGQTAVVRRVVQGVLLGGHALLEGLPGEGKTTCVRRLSEIVGFRYRRVQFRPDMLPSDLLGTRLLSLDAGQAALQWVHGPVYSPLLIADEINRAPAKVQAALLEAMQERQNSRLDLARAEPLYHPADRADLRRFQGRSCFGVDIPHPDDPGRVPFSVFATQNPIELEGTYPLSEAAQDRFLFKLTVPRPPIRAATDIVRANAAPPALPGPPPPEDPADLPLWIRAASFFERARRLLIDRVQGRLIAPRGEQAGLWDRVCLAIHLSHYKAAPARDWEAGDGEMLPAAFRSRDQEAMAAFLADWLHRGPAGQVRSAVETMLTRRLFEYVEAGSSTRGLLDWPRAAAAEALLAGDLGGDGTGLRRRHFRAVADDVLRHRIRLSPQARADNVRPEHLVHLLVDTLLPDAPDEAAEDRMGLLA
jgi:hypothetical protein